MEFNEANNPQVCQLVALPHEIEGPCSCSQFLSMSKQKALQVLCPQLAYRLISFRIDRSDLLALCKLPSLVALSVRSPEQMPHEKKESTSEYPTDTDQWRYASPYPDVAWPPLEQNQQGSSAHGDAQNGVVEPKPPALDRLSSIEAPSRPSRLIQPALRGHTQT